MKPQILTIFVSAPAGVDDYSVDLFTIPRIVMGSVNSATVMEILKVDWYLGLEDETDIVAHYAGYLSFRVIRSQNSTATVATFAADVAESSVFAAVFIRRELLTSGGQASHLPVSIDLTDSNGNGLLVATDQLFATTGSVSNTVVASGVCKILYRMVNIGITEYVGIVQSQV